ncbi:hypothetical protein FO519_004083 [Halicephalobus sp. NKZ332]|nr:hypothetical protein FO519_004083 [Halicephalobus sp. NKZ332]
MEELKVEYTSKFKGNAIRTFTMERAKNLQSVYDEFCTELSQLPEGLKVEMKGKHILFPLHSRRPEQENVLPFVSILNKVLWKFTFEATEGEFYGKQYSWKIKNQLTENKVFEFSISVFQFDRERHIRELEAQEDEDANLPNYSSSENEEDDEEMLIDKRVDDFDLDPPGSEDNSEFDDDSDDEDFEI